MTKRILAALFAICMGFLALVAIALTARSNMMVSGHGVGPTPVSPPTPVAVVLTPSSATVADNTASLTPLSTISVTMSDGSTYAGSPLTENGAFTSISGTTLQLSRALTGADDGSTAIIVSATQNSVTQTATFNLTVSPLAGVAFKGAAGVFCDGTSCSWSHTVDPTSNALLIEFAQGGTACVGTATADDVVSVTFDGAGAVLLGKRVSNITQRLHYVYGLLNPHTGTHTVTVTLGHFESFRTLSSDYANVAGFGAVVVNSHAAGDCGLDTSLTTTLTTTVANSLIYLGVLDSTPDLVGNANTVVRANDAQYVWNFDSGAPIASPGAYSLTTSASAAQAMSHIAVELKPGTSVTPPPTPVAVILTPPSASVLDTATNTTLLSTISVTTSDGSAFAGSLTENGAFTSISGTSLQLSRNLTGADDGSVGVLVTGTQNSVSRSSTFNLTVTPVASTVPAPATAAGFTTTVLDYDFSQPSWATRSNWLDCAGASSPLFYLAYAGFGGHIGGECAFINQQVDPSSGQNALHLQWTDSQFKGSAWVNDITLQTCNSSQPCVGNRIPPNAYFEVTARYTPPHPSGDSTMDLWSYDIAGNGPEWDGIEVYSSNTDAASTWHNGGPSAELWAQQNPPGIPGGISYAAYHKWAWRVTNDGSTNAYMCSYVDDQPNGCGPWSPSSGQLTNPPMQTMQFAVGVAGWDNTNQVCRGNHPITTCNSIGTIDVWISRARVFSCDGFNSSSKCFSSTPNP